MNSHLRVNSQSRELTCNSSGNNNKSDIEKLLEENDVDMKILKI